MGEDTWAQLQKAYPERLTEEMVWQTPDEGANGYASVYSALSAQIIYCRLICRFIAAGKKYKDEASRMSKVLKAKDAGQKKKLDSEAFHRCYDPCFKSLKARVGFSRCICICPCYLTIEYSRACSS